MALNDNTRAPQQPATHTEGLRQEREQFDPRQREQRQERPASGFSGLTNGILGLGLRTGYDGINRFADSEVVSTALKALDAVMDSVIKKDTPAKAEILTLDNQSHPTLDYSLLVVTVREPAAPEKGVAYYTLLLSASGHEPDSIQKNISGVLVEKTPRFSDSFNPQLRDMVAQVVQAKFRDFDAVPASGMVVTKSMDWTDADRVRELLTNAVIACSDAVADEPISIEMIIEASGDRNAQTLELNVTTRNTRNDETPRDVTGEPYREDMRTEMRARFKDNAGNVSLRTVAAISGYMDLVYDPMDYPGRSERGYRRPSEKIDGYTYRPVYVITRSVFSILSNIPMQLLALSGVAGLYDNNIGMQCLYPDPSSKMADFRNVGYLNVEAQYLGERSALTDVLEGSPEEISTYMGDIIQPDFDIVMDIAHAGPDTWRNEVFLDAARGSPEAFEAIQRSADELTGGLMSRHYNSPRNPFYVIDTLEVGHFIHNGEVMDTREADYTAVATAVGSDDPHALIEFSNASSDPSLDDDVRIYNKTRIVQSMLPGVTFYGKVDRIGIEFEWLQALLLAVNEAGLVLVSTQRNAGGLGRNRYQPDAGRRYDNRSISNVGLVSHRDTRGEGRGSRSYGTSGRRYGGRR